MIRTIGFDFDGTLVQSNEIKREAYFAVTQTCGDLSKWVSSALESNAGDRSAILGQIERDATHAGLLLPRSDGKAWASIWVEDYSRFCEKAIATCPEVRGATAALESLSGLGYRLFVNSATPLIALRSILARRGLDRYFDEVYGGFHAKAANLIQELSLSGCQAEEMIFIGDNEMDRAAAVAAGCIFIGIINDASHFREPPKFLAHDMTEVAHLLSGLGVGANESNVTQENR